MIGIEKQVLNPPETPLVILSEGCFGVQQSKTATGVIRYGQWPVTAVMDSQFSGKTVTDVIPDQPPIPIVSRLSEALALSPKPKALLIGTAPMGGGLPDSYYQVVKEALEAGLHIISGLHIFLNEIPELVDLAQAKGLRLWDVRQPPSDNVVTRQLPRPAGTRVITMVGSDCSVGKMYTALELNKTLTDRGEASQFVATGQTGIMITGHGVPLDRAIGDFMAGYVERAIDESIQQHQPKWVIVEGQGSLLHPAYSGVTMALIHGSAPDALILCHNPKLKGIRNFESVPIPPLSTLVNIYESAAGWIKPAKVLGISLNTSSFTEAQAKALVQEYEDETGLPVTDPVRFGMGVLADRVIQAF